MHDTTTFLNVDLDILSREDLAPLLLVHRETNWESPMRCPLCEASCVAEPIGAITLDRCAGCHALWFDRTELAGAFNARVPGIATDWGQPLPTSAEEGPLCPRTAGVRLQGYTWLGEPFWRCPTCKGVLMTAPAWQGMLAAAERQLLERHQRLSTLDGVQFIVEILGSGFG